MNSKDRLSGSITKPLLKDLIERDQANARVMLTSPVVENQPLAPPDLYQDAGGGYNLDFTYPQE
ncbi:MAG: hypothetical protein JO217_12190 [Acidobacteriaceae bacterium]|nr:hypothetical protein [Acidobacteriaceae bacterium]MBV9443445.1 hypothetical protein [Acidobacteriaceae bacterium]